MGTRLYLYGEFEVRDISYIGLRLPVSLWHILCNETLSNYPEILLNTGFRSNMMVSSFLFVSDSGGLPFRDSRRCKESKYPILSGNSHFNSIRLYPCHTFFFFLWLRRFQCVLSHRAVFQTVILEYGVSGRKALGRDEAQLSHYIQTRLSLCPRFCTFFPFQQVTGCAPTSM